TSDAFGFADRVDGLIHAANFTFRGNLAEPDRVTASLWSELTGLTWRNRTAEAIMLGAAVYNRKIQLQQLYIRQRSNQFTLSGEAEFPTNSSDRKSTRLNSSHVAISYAVFGLKKKNETTT